MRCGASQICITPPVGVELAGFVAREQPSVGLHDDLYVHGLYLEQENERLLWLHADLLAFERDWVRRLRSSLARDLGLAERQVLISATHTHSGPAPLVRWSCLACWKDPVMIEIIAHRGASAYEPENTLRAFESAIRMGATMLELDVHLTRDGELVVLHDAEISHTTNGHGDVANLTLAEAQTYDAGLGEHLPSLREVIELVRGRARLYIELKGLFTPEPLVRLLRAEAFCDDVIAGSFLPWLPQKVKYLAPEIRTALLFKDLDPPRMVGWAQSIGADFAHPCWEHLAPQPHRLLTPEIVQMIRRARLGIVLWHEERPEELRQLAALDVDGICTNTPDVLRDILHGAVAPGQNP